MVEYTLFFCYSEIISIIISLFSSPGIHQLSWNPGVVLLLRYFDFKGSEVLKTLNYLKQLNTFVTFMIIIIRSILFLYQIVYFDGDPEGIFIIVSNGLWGIMLEKTFSIVFFFFQYIWCVAWFGAICTI